MTSAIGRSTVAWIGGSICALVLAAVSMFGVHIADVAERVDRQAFLRDAKALTQGVFLLGEFAAVEQLSLAEWTEAYENISERYNPVWVERHLGKEVFADPDEEEALLVAASGEILHSSSKVHGRPHRVETLRAARLIAAKARQALDRAVTADATDRVELKLPLENALFEGVYTHAFAILGDVTAIVAAAVVLPDRGDLTTRPEAPVVLVNIRPIREDMLAALGRMTQLGDIRFDRRRAAGPNLWGYKLESALGTAKSAIGDDADTSPDRVFAMWPRKNVGAAVMATMVPSLIVMASALVFLTLGTIIILRRMTGHLARSEATARHASRHDPATGLANRAWFCKSFDRILTIGPEGGSEGRPEPYFAVALVDIDYFKPVNDTLGHAAGDAVILAVAERMASLGAYAPVCARLGGDEFVALSQWFEAGTQDDQLQAFATSLHAAVCQPVPYGVHVIPVSTSIGIARATQHGDIDALLAEADVALYRAKNDGRGCFRIHDPALDSTDTESELDELNSVDALRRKAQELRGIEGIAPRNPAEAAVNA